MLQLEIQTNFAFFALGCNIDLRFKTMLHIEQTFPSMDSDTLTES